LVHGVHSDAEGFCQGGDREGHIVGQGKEAAVGGGAPDQKPSSEATFRTSIPKPEAGGAGMKRDSISDLHEAFAVFTNGCNGSSELVADGHGAIGRALDAAHPYVAHI
jgi:hypothetical protein